MAFINIPLKDNNTNLTPDEFNYFVNKVNSLKLSILQGSGFVGSLRISDTPDIDGWYFASDSGTYVNAGNLDVLLDGKLNIIIVSNNATTFSLVETALNFTLSQTFDKTSITQVSSDKATYDGLIPFIPTNSDFVDLSTNQTIAGNKTFTGSTSTDQITVSGLASLAGDVRLNSGKKITLDSNTDSFAYIKQIVLAENEVPAKGVIYGAENGHHFINGEDNAYDIVKAGSFVADGGTSSQFLKADGTRDSVTYATSGELSTLNDSVNTESARSIEADNAFKDAFKISETYDELRYSSRVLGDGGVVESLICIISDLDSSTINTTSNTIGGVLPIGMTTTQVLAIIAPETGLTVYNTTLNTLCFFDGGGWQKVSHTAM